MSVKVSKMSRYAYDILKLENSRKRIHRFEFACFKEMSSFYEIIPDY